MTEKKEEDKYMRRILKKKMDLVIITTDKINSCKSKIENT